MEPLWKASKTNRVDGIYYSNLVEEPESLCIMFDRLGAALSLATLLGLAFLGLGCDSILRLRSHDGSW